MTAVRRGVHACAPARAVCHAAVATLAAGVLLGAGLGTAHAAQASRPQPESGVPDDRPASVPDTAGPASEANAPSDDTAPSVDPCHPEPLSSEVPPATALPADRGPEWLDRMEQRLRLGGCRSAAWLDGLFGREGDPADYRRVSGSVAPSVLWTEYDGFTPRVRFRVNLPLPQIDDRLRAFIGRVDREEFVTERAEPSGLLPRQFGTIGEEQTLLGLGYRPAAQGGGRFDFGAGIRLRAPLDPYVKASYRRAWLLDPDTTVQLKPTVFWQQTEQFGVTTRADYDHAFDDRWFTRVTGSVTYSGRSQGLRGYSNATLFHKLSDRRAAAVQLGIDGETGAEVPLREYGVRAIYRQNLWRDWLVVELRTSLTWPRELRDEPRKPSWGAGFGFEMLFGGGDFRGSP